MSSSVTRGCRLFTVILVPSKGLRTGCHTEEKRYEELRGRHAPTRPRGNNPAEFTSTGLLRPRSPPHPHHPVLKEPTLFRSLSLCLECLLFILPDLAAQTPCSGSLPRSLRGTRCSFLTASAAFFWETLHRVTTHSDLSDGLLSPLTHKL